MPNGVDDDLAILQTAIDTCFGTTGAPLSPLNYRPLYIPQGDWKVSAPLTMRAVQGGWVYGAGRFATKITNTTAGSVFVTNGCAYSLFENMRLVSSGSAVVFDLDWDNTGQAALQSNTLSNLYFEGGGHGLRIGHTGYMGSENLIQNCGFSGHSVAGVRTRNYNALQNKIAGGNIQSCDIGVYVEFGSVQDIIGTGFQLSTTWDVKVDNSADDCMSLIGCRSESPNFVRAQHIGLHMAACNQINLTSGKFFEGTGLFSLSGCTSIAGQVISNNNGGDIKNCQFGRDDWIATANGARVNVSMTRVGETLVDSGSGTPLMLTRGYVSGASVYTAS
jgi:hypothetical protein